MLFEYFQQNLAVNLSSQLSAGCNTSQCPIIWSIMAAWHLKEDCSTMMAVMLSLSHQHSLSCHLASLVVGHTPIALHHSRLLIQPLVGGDAGKQRRWDMISSHSSVGVIIYHTGLDALIVVRQFRPPVTHLSLTAFLQTVCPYLLFLPEQVAFILCEVTTRYGCSQIQACCF